MGDEADADWEAGGYEQGREFVEADVKDRYRQILARAARTSPFRNRRKRRPPQPSHKGNAE